MRTAVVSLAFVVLSSGAATDTHGETTKPEDPHLSDVVIADELRSAFYEHAPMALSGAMSKAVHSWCSGTDRQLIADLGELNAETVEWLCGKHKLHYFRSVYINGDKGPHGLVCKDANLKYFGIDMVAEVTRAGACVPAEFDGTDYELHFDRINDSGDASECNAGNPLAMPALAIKLR